MARAYRQPFSPDARHFFSGVVPACPCSLAAATSVADRYVCCARISFISSISALVIAHNCDSTHNLRAFCGELRLSLLGIPNLAQRVRVAPDLLLAVSVAQSPTSPGVRYGQDVEKGMKQTGAERGSTKQTADKTVQVHLRLPGSYAELLKQIASERDQTQSAVIRSLLRAWRRAPSTK